MTLPPFITNLLGGKKLADLIPGIVIGALGMLLLLRPDCSGGIVVPADLNAFKDSLLRALGDSLAYSDSTFTATNDSLESQLASKKTTYIYLKADADSSRSLGDTTKLLAMLVAQSNQCDSLLAYYAEATTRIKDLLAIKQKRIDAAKEEPADCRERNRVLDSVIDAANKKLDASLPPSFHSDCTFFLGLGTVTSADVTASLRYGNSGVAIRLGGTYVAKKVYPVIAGGFSHQLFSK